MRYVDHNTVVWIGGLDMIGARHVVTIFGWIIGRSERLPFGVGYQFTIAAYATYNIYITIWPHPSDIRMLDDDTSCGHRGCRHLRSFHSYRNSNERGPAFGISTVRFQAL
jgi:hypothetical protein